MGSLGPCRSVSLPWLLWNQQHGPGSGQGALAEPSALLYKAGSSQGHVKPWAGVG